MKTTLLMFLFVAYSLNVCADEKLIPYKIIKRYELASIKLSLDIEAPVIDGRLPNVKELENLSIELAKT